MSLLLLDTHVLLWRLADDLRLGRRTHAAISNRKHRVYVSAATTWEIAIKSASGKLKAPSNLEGVIEDSGFHTLPIAVSHTIRAGHLPLLHHHPFDRMLVAQAQAENLILVTSDARIRPYEVHVLDASE